MDNFCKSKPCWIGYGKSKRSAVEMLWFHKDIEVLRTHDGYPIEITAECRYRLIVNGHFAANGPCRTTADKKYFDTVDIAPFLQSGKNSVDVFVAHYSDDSLDASEFIGGPASVVAKPFSALWINDFGGALTTDGSWLVREDKKYGFLWMDKPRSQLCFCEKVDFNICEAEFEEVIVLRDYSQFSEYGTVSYYDKLLPRPADMPYLRRGGFKSVVRTDRADIFKDICTDKIIVPHSTETFVELDVETYKTAFIELDVCGKADIKLCFAEGYFQKDGDKLKKKKRSLCSDNSVIIGMTDEVYSSDFECHYITYDYRAFRFVKLLVKTYEKDVSIKLNTVETGYPLSVEAEFESSDERYNQLWDVSLRTIKSCMYETHMDCPYYEQLQYVMDTYMQIVYTSCISKDLRLARKAIDDFCHAMTPDGRMPCCAPAKYNQYIWGFPIFWILMIDYYYRQTGDKSIILDYISSVSVLLSNLKKSVSSESGTVVVKDGWSFIDWMPGWDKGAPVELNKPNTVYTLMLSAAFNTAADLAREIDCSLYVDYENAAYELNEAANRLAYNREYGMYENSPGREEFSMHTQIWAVLSGAASHDNARQILLKAKNSGLKVSYCYRYLYFRAFELAGIYDFAKDALDDLISELDKDLTTLPEDFLEQRSDCHAWSSVALSEYPKLFFGLKTSDGVISVKPNPDFAEHCRITTLQNGEKLRLEYIYKADTLELKLHSETAHDWRVELPNGKTVRFADKSSVNYISKYFKEDK